MSEQSYGAPAIWAWILLIGTCILAAVPVLGILAWVIGGATITIAIILAIIVLVRGGTAHGVILLLASFIGVPAFVVIAPIISSALFVGAAEQHNKANTPPKIETTAEIAEPTGVLAEPAPQLENGSETQGKAK